MLPPDLTLPFYPFDMRPTIPKDMTAQQQGTKTVKDTNPFGIDRIFAR